MISYHFVFSFPIILSLDRIKNKIIITASNVRSIGILTHIWCLIGLTSISCHGRPPVLRDHCARRITHAIKYQWITIQTCGCIACKHMVSLYASKKTWIEWWSITGEPTDAQKHSSTGHLSAGVYRHDFQCLRLWATSTRGCISWDTPDTRGKIPLAPTSYIWQNCVSTENHSNKIFDLTITRLNTNKHNSLCGKSQ